jgi:hypothetical protein
MLDLIIAGDFRELRRFWAAKMPNMPQPQNDEEAELVMHQTRTMASIPVKLRIWSHRWLKERDQPSFLPSHLIEQAEKFPVENCYSVGIAIGAVEASMLPVAERVRHAMETSVQEAMAGRVRPSNEQLRAVMSEAREKETKNLLG